MNLQKIPYYTFWNEGNMIAYDKRTYKTLNNFVLGEKLREM